jgi:2-dehydropantoate 2-reductase
LVLEPVKGVDLRYIIYGAGGIGSIMGGHLARTGHDVVLIGRPGHVNVVNDRGLRLITPLDTYALKIPAVTGPQQINFSADDVVCLCMKGQDTEGALQDLKKVTAGVPVFCFQNGVRNEEIAARYFADVYGAMVRVGAVYLTDGEVIARRDPPGWYIIGRYPAGTDALVEAVAGGLREAGYLVRTSADVMPYKWGKLMTNLSNVIGAITGGEWGSPRALHRAVFEEARAIIEKAGVRWISQEQVGRDWPETETSVRARLDTITQSSTWQSLARRQGSVETEFLNGEIVRVAEGLGLKAPLNEKLVAIAREMAANHETPGKYTATQLAEILGLPEEK